MAVLLGFARAGAVVTRRAADALAIVAAAVWRSSSPRPQPVFSPIPGDWAPDEGLALDGDRAATAERLGISASTLARRIRSAADSEG